MDKSVALLLLVLGICQAEQNWYNLKSHFSLLPFTGFQDEPRSVSDATSEGWEVIGDGCADRSQPFPGIRMQDKENPEIIIIYDVNNFVAGMQSVVPLPDTLEDEYYDFSKSPFYQKSEIDGQEVYLTTAYFIPPSKICTGRTQEDFDIEGTGNQLSFQNGPTSDSVMIIPGTESDVERTWYKHNCFLNMGNHYFAFDAAHQTNCRDLIPFQLIFDHQLPQPLVGFVFQHLAKLDGDRFEDVNVQAIESIVIDPPQCLKDATTVPGVSTIHIYFQDWVETCLF